MQESYGSPPESYGSVSRRPGVLWLVMMIGDQQTRIPVMTRSCQEVAPPPSGACARHQAGASCYLARES